MFKDFKISIRLSIISLFVILLSMIGFAIITINYVALDQILTTSAKNLIEETSLLVKERMRMYLRPLRRDLILIRDSIQQGIVEPENQKPFDRFLIEKIRYNPDIFMVYYGRVNGDFYGVDHEKPNEIGLNHVLNSVVPAENIRYELNSDGNKLIKKERISKPYDPRTRYWYQEAVLAKKPIWTGIYTFFLFSKGKDLVPGITAAAPVYDKNKNLKGVVALDFTIGGIQNFIKDLAVTKNAMIYVTNDKQQVIAYRNLSENIDIRGQVLTPALLEKYHIPLNTFLKENQKPLIRSYKHKGELFFISYQPITGIVTQDPWHITIFVPAKDVLAPLWILSLHSVFLAIFVLLIGLLIARYFSKKISKPIIHLSKEAQEITKLNLRPSPLLKSMIKEINYLDLSLYNMRISLSSFQRYIPSSLVNKLITSGKIAQVGGKNQRLTVLFSDIKDFTKLCEGANPQQLMMYLSDYFQSMTESVLSHQGTLDKYIGDAVMAFWNAPTLDKQHPLHACQTAVDMLKRVEILNTNNRHLGLTEFMVRIGINTGDAIVGNVGSEDRLNFTALGDTVNLASRLESTNKIYYSQIIVSEATYKQVKTQFSFRLLDEITVRGKRQGTTIYELVVKPDLKNLKQHKKEFELAFSLYQNKQWKQSIALFENLTPAFQGDRLAEVYIKRCQQLMHTPPADWDGIWHSL